jgi:hypothetical protein
MLPYTEKQNILISEQDLDFMYSEISGQRYQMASTQEKFTKFYAITEYLSK